MKSICITKSGDIITEYVKLSDIWKDNSIELIWDIKNISNKYYTVVFNSYVMGTRTSSLVEFTDRTYTGRLALQLSNT